MKNELDLFNGQNENKSVKDFKGDEKTMTVKEVASVLNVTPEAIKKHIRILYPNLLRNGVETKLTESQVTEIKQRMLPTTEVAGALTSIDIERMTLQVIEYHRNKVLELEKEIKAQQARLEEQKPKVEFYDDVTGSADTIDMKEAAKILNIKGLGRNNLFELLRNRKILDNHNIPYQQFVDAGYFRVIETKYQTNDGETKISLKTVVFQKGLDYIRKITKISSKMRLDA